LVRASTHSIKRRQLNSVSLQTQKLEQIPFEFIHNPRA
jgi:hypothetical protein